MKKEGKKKQNIANKKNILVFSLILLALIMLFLFLKTLPLTTKIIETPPTPDNCSNESIKEVWEFIFKGSSENLTIKEIGDIYGEENYSKEDQELMDLLFPNGGCPIYYLYQINGTTIRTLFGTDMWFIIDMKGVVAIEINYTQEGIDEVIGNLNSSSYSYDGVEFIMEEFLNNKTIQRRINTSEEAKIIFESVFNISSSNWTKEDEVDFEGANISAFGFAENESVENITIFGESIDPMKTTMKGGVVFQNYSINMYTYLDASFLGNLKKIEEIYGNWTSPINTTLKNISVEINNSKLKMSEELDLFSTSRSEIQKVEILQNNQTIIETEINFTKEHNFDWTKIILKKQGINSTRGYVIVNGLNYTKNITVDRLNNESESVCIKDSEINSIQEISQNCTKADEYILECPGNTSNSAGNFTCKIEGSKFIITGLKHSAIVEILPETEAEPCISNWTCEEWSNFEDQCGYRLCTDLNNCMNDSTKPLEYNDCPVCIPDWDCTDFSPEKCPKSERRTRTCTDLNNCGTEQGKPPITQNCERKNNLIWIIIGILAAGIIALIILLIIKKNQDKTNSSPPPQYPKQNTSPPTHPPSSKTNYANQQYSNVQKKTYQPGYYYPDGY